MASYSALILAGGASRRMGTPKAVLPFGGITLIERLVTTLRSEFADIMIAAAPRDFEQYAVETVLRDHQAVRLIRDSQAFAGPAAALIGGLRAAHHPIVFACSCDLPFLRSSIAKAICDRIDNFDAVVPRVEGYVQPLCAAYRRGVAELIERALVKGEQRLVEMVSHLETRILDEPELRTYDGELRSFINLNTPDDYARARRIFEDCKSQGSR